MNDNAHSTAWARCCLLVITTLHGQQM